MAFENGLRLHGISPEDAERYPHFAKAVRQFRAGFNAAATDAETDFARRVPEGHVVVFDVPHNGINGPMVRNTGILARLGAPVAITPIADEANRIQLRLSADPGVVPAFRSIRIAARAFSQWELAQRMLQGHIGPNALDSDQTGMDKANRPIAWARRTGFLPQAYLTSAMMQQLLGGRLAWPEAEPRVEMLLQGSDTLPPQRFLSMDTVQGMGQAASYAALHLNPQYTGPLGIDPAKVPSIDMDRMDRYDP